MGKANLMHNENVKDNKQKNSIQCLYSVFFTKFSFHDDDEGIIILGYTIDRLKNVYNA